MSFHKIPNNATTATSYNHPNTIMLRDLDGASRVSSLIMRGVDFVKECIPSTLLTRGYIYFSTHNKNYALLRNAETDIDKIHLSFVFGQNNKSGGNFSIRTEQQTNLIVKNNMVGINQPDPIASLDISGTVIVNGSITTSSLCQGPIYATSAGQLQTIKPFHIINAFINIPFTSNTIFVLEVVREIILPPQIYNGYSMTIINKCGESVAIVSTDNMFNAFYLPDGGLHFSLEPNRKIETTYYCTATSSSWVFNTF